MPVKRKSQVRRRNLLPKRAFQVRLILKIVLIVALSVAFSIAVTCGIFYHLQSLQFRGDVPFQYLPEGADAPPASPSALSIMLPAILISGLITIVVSVFGGLMWSFRIAGPLYRFQLCAREIADGNLAVRWRLRERDELHDVANVLDDMMAQLKDLHQRGMNEWERAHELFHGWTDWVKGVGEELQAVEHLDVDGAKELLMRAGRLFADTEDQPTISQIHRCLDRGLETCGCMHCQLGASVNGFQAGGSPQDQTGDIGQQEGSPT